MESGLATTSASSLRALGYKSQVSRGLCKLRFLKWLWVQLLVAVGGSFRPQPPSCYLFTWEVLEERLSLKTVIKCLMGSSALYLPVVISLQVLQRGFTFFDIPFLIYMPVEALPVTLCISCWVQFQRCLGLLQSIPTKLNLIFIPSQVTCPSFSCPCFYFFPFSLTEGSLLSCAGLLPSLPNFLRMESQLLHTVEDFFTDLPALFYYLVPEGRLTGNPIDCLPEELEFCFPKIQGPDFRPYLTHMLRTAASTSAWSLQPNLTPILTS